ncbi:MAG: hypothetical protein BMS9Abin26_1717 [Gammaproteobacteria bacterium]|nr:MAG: hypothetical protein BMS9Abin26_1717 [Gammaproteobacteria bacterium]
MFASNTAEDVYTIKYRSPANNIKGNNLKGKNFRVLQFQLAVT